MIVEAKIRTVPEGIKVTTTVKEDDVYPNILTASKEIGRHRVRSKIAELVGFGGSSLGAFAIAYAVFQQPVRLSYLALAVTAEALCFGMAIIGMQERDKADARKKALQESFQSDFLFDI